MFLLFISNKFHTLQFIKKKLKMIIFFNFGFVKVKKKFDTHCVYCNVKKYIRNINLNNKLKENK